MRRFALPCSGYRHGTPKAGALSAALHSDMKVWDGSGVFFQFSTWDLNFPLPVPGGLAYLLRQRWSSSFCYCGRYSCCLCPCSYNVLIIVSAVAPLAIQCYLQAILHEFDNGLLEQILDALKNHLRKVGFLHFSHFPVGSLCRLSATSIFPADGTFSGFRFL